MTRTRWDAYVAGDFTIPANESLGIAFEPADDPREGMSFTWKVREEHCNSAGNLQGGFLGAAVDALFGATCAAHLPEDMYPAMAEMKISFLRPAPAGVTLRASARVLKAGKRLLFVEGEVTNEGGELIAKISGTEIPAKI